MLCMRAVWGLSYYISVYYHLYLFGRMKLDRVILIRDE